jgi:hypothetical protein
MHSMRLEHVYHVQDGVSMCVASGWLAGWWCRRGKGEEVEGERGGTPREEGLQRVVVFERLTRLTHLLTDYKTQTAEAMALAGWARVQVQGRSRSDGVEQPPPLPIPG